MKKSTLFLSLLVVAAIASIALLVVQISTAAPVSITPVPATATPAPTRAASATPVAFAGQPVFYGSLSLVLPAGLASGISGSQVPRADGDLSWWQKTPGHIQLKLEGYLLPGKSRQPQIFVYPAQGYAEMVPTAFESLRRINNILGSAQLPTSRELLPALPNDNSIPAFVSNVQAISFQGGKGVRFLTQYGQAAAPVNNQDLFYCFQGVTQDGKTYIVAVFPVSASFLAETSDRGAVVPAGGVPFPDITDPRSDFKAYYIAVTSLLNAAPAQKFVPTLPQLDALIESIQITR